MISGLFYWGTPENLSSFDSKTLGHKKGPEGPFLFLFISDDQGQCEESGFCLC
jgi:hypothetical protein